MTDAPVTREYSFKDLVTKVDPDHNKKETVYQFTGGREFKNTDNDRDSGIYGDS